MTLSLRSHRRRVTTVLAVAATCSALALTSLPMTGASAATSATTVSGTIGKAAWTAKMPANWNGTLLLWNHGIRTTVDPNRAAEWAPKGTDGDTTDALLAKGYALAGSSYSSNGFAVRDAVNDDIALLAELTKRFGKPARTYVWGASLGGLVTETLAEERPDLVTAAAPACGVLAGAVPIGDQTLDTLVMARTFFAPTLKVGGYTSDAEALAAVETLKTAVTSALADPATQTGAVGRLLGITALQGLPMQTRNYNGAATTSQAGAAAETVLTQAGAAIMNYRDAVARVGGYPATNVGTSYVGRATPEAVARFEAVGLPGSLLRSYGLTLDRRAVRVPANAGARAAAKTLGTPTGKAMVPTVTMHTAYDPFVTAPNEALFASRVAAAGATANVLQLFVTPPAYADASATTGSGAPYGAGHCTFTSGQWTQLLSTLETFVASGKPSLDAVAAAWKTAGVPGLSTTFTPLPWRGTTS
jgi:dienelactone hydrolase